MIAALDSEHALLGAAMYDPTACADVLDRVRPEQFAEPTHSLIWGELRRGGIHDPVLLAQRLAHVSAFVTLGGIAFLANLVDRAQLYAIGAHADAVIDAAMRRHLHALAEQTADGAEKRPGEAESLIAELERGAADIARARAPVAVPVGLTALDNLEAAWRGDYVGVSTGLRCIDHVTGGIRMDDVWFFGGRTSMGKSVMGIEVARGIAEQGRGVLMFSLEMPTREVQARLIATMAHDFYDTEQVRYGDILKGRTLHSLKDRAREAASRLASLPFTVTDAGGLTIDDIRSQALRQVRAWEKAGVQPGCVLIDHVGLIQPTRRSDSKAAETADIVNQLKPLAKQLCCPVVALAQVNRQTEGRTDKRPTLGDLNWSGAIEQIADFIGLLYRESYYLTRSSNVDEQNQGFAREHDLEILIHKNRSGPICNIKAWVDVACNAVRDLPDEGRRA